MNAGTLKVDSFGREHQCSPNGWDGIWFSPILGNRRRSEDWCRNNLSSRKWWREECVPHSPEVIYIAFHGKLISSLRIRGHLTLIHEILILALKYVLINSTWMSPILRRKAKLNLFYLYCLFVCVCSWMLSGGTHSDNKLFGVCVKRF